MWGVQHLQRFASANWISCATVASLLGVLTLLTFGLSGRGQAQSASRETKLGSVIGTVSNVNGDTVVNATVVLESSDRRDRRTAVTKDNGFFEFHDVKPGIPYHVTVSAEGLAEWKSPFITIVPNQFKILTDIRLRVARVSTTVEVTQTAEEVATEQVKAEEKQRIFGIIPNFYVVYEPNPVPLTTKLKFRLALKTAIDPVTFLGIGILSGAQQAGDTPDYGQGVRDSPSDLALIPPTLSPISPLAVPYCRRYCTRIRAIFIRVRAPLNRGFGMPS